MQVEISSSLIKSPVHATFQPQMPTAARRHRESRRCVETMIQAEFTPINTSQIHFQRFRLKIRLVLHLAPLGFCTASFACPHPSHHDRGLEGETCRTYCLAHILDPLGCEVRPSGFRRLQSTRVLLVILEISQPQTPPAEATSQPYDIALWSQVGCPQLTSLKTP
jgi:hypothetical protein